jgi:hypothetical protein
MIALCELDSSGTGGASVESNDTSDSKKAGEILDYMSDY